MKSGVYRLVNVVNKKCYVGSSTNVHYRLWRHRKQLNLDQHENQRLQNAWNKYGESSFLFRVLLFCDREQLLQKEQEMIDKYQSATEKGYNLCSIAGNCLGIKRSQETKDKMKGNTNASGRKGQHHSQETKELMRIAKLGKSSGMLGKSHSIKSKDKMALAKIGKPGNNQRGNELLYLSSRNVQNQLKLKEVKNE
jgi:group I intron endonuclease